MCIKYHQLFVPKGWNQFAWTDNSLMMYLFEVASMPFTYVSVDILDLITLNIEGENNIDTFSKNAQLIMANKLGLKAISHSSDEIFRHKN